jgi:NitT/TauT family transport system substrate-binding protein
MRLRSYSLTLLLASALVMTGISACSSNSSSTQDSPSQGPELSSITIDTQDSPDSAALWIAEKDGYFKQQGLTVHLNYIQGTAAALPDLLAHTTDFVMASYPTAFGEQAKDPALGYRFVVDDEQGAPDTNVFMVAKNSKIKSVTQLEGKPVGFPSLGLDFGALALCVELREAGLTGKCDPKKTWIDTAVGFTDMNSELASGQIDAAFEIQPFITIGETATGARPLVDVMSGAMANFPVTGWGTTEWFVQHYPKTVAAFQRAVEKGQQVAATDPALVRQLVLANVPHMSASLADVMPLQTYNTAISATRLQRVADVLEEFGALPANFNVASLIVPLPSGA